jgi:hypothetical protein
VWVFGGSGGLKKNKEHREDALVYLGSGYEALYPVANDPCTQEHPNSRGYNRV